MEPVKEMTRFIFDLTKIIFMIVVGFVVIFLLWFFPAALFDDFYKHSVYACPDRRVRLTDREAISYTKKYIENKGYFKDAERSKDYNNDPESDHDNRYGWGVSRRPPSNRFQAESIDVFFGGRETGAIVDCTILACGVMVGCDY